MVKLVCPADNPRAEGLECAKTCQNYDLECMSMGCVSGCLCPPGMVSHPLLPGVGSCPFSCRQRERKKQELNQDGNQVAVVMGAGVGEVPWLSQPPKSGREMVGKCLGLILMRFDKNA